MGEKEKRMKKNVSRKLTLNRETLRTLERGSLRAIHGANSQNWSQCVSECIPCDPEISTSCP
jgi:hypothetical protein